MNIAVISFITSGQCNEVKTRAWVKMILVEICNEYVTGLSALIERADVFD